MALCDCEGIGHVISEDASTLAKYLDRSRESGAVSAKVVLLRNGFDSTWFENGQTRLVP
jgi:hypothetical protein